MNTLFFNNKSQATIKSSRHLSYFRYRFYVGLVALLMLFSVGSDMYNIAPVDLSAYNKISQNLVFSHVESIYAKKNDVIAYTIIDQNGNRVFLDAAGKIFKKEDVLASQLASLLWPSVNLNSDEKAQPKGPAPLDQIIPAPLNAEKRNLLEYPKYGITASIKYTTIRDFKDENGNDYSDKGDLGNPCSFEAQNTPVQKLLREGIVHMYFSPKPGELPNSKQGTYGSSYIVGHSSDCTRHAYSTIFKALDRVSQVGEEFFIYDESGRKLKFKVFQVERILDSQTDIAYKDFGDKRVVTLQTSIFVSNYQIDRWLTRGELVVE